MVPNLILAVLVLSALVAYLVVRDRWRFHDGYRAGHKAATEESNRELNDMLERYGLSVNGVITGTDDTYRVQGA
jgi:hypothetical protein